MRSDEKLCDALGRYVLTLFYYGTLLGPAQVARSCRSPTPQHHEAVNPLMRRGEPGAIPDDRVWPGT